MGVGGQREKKAAPWQLLPGLPSLVSGGRQTHRNRALNNTYPLDTRESLETLLTSSRLRSVFVMNEGDALMPPDVSVLPL